MRKAAALIGSVRDDGPFGPLHATEGGGWSEPEAWRKTITAARLDVVERLREIARVETNPAGELRGYIVNYANRLEAEIREAGK